MDKNAFLDYLIQKNYIHPTIEQTQEYYLSTDLEELLSKFLKQNVLSEDQFQQYQKEFDQNEISSSNTVLLPDELTILKELEALSHKLGSQFDPLKSHVAQTKLAYSESPTILTPADTEAMINSTQTERDSHKSVPPFSLENFDERYEVLDNLGEGGMGVVQRVYDHLLGREVALKKIKFSGTGIELLSKKQSLLLWRLHQEAKITAILEHPHIVPLYEMQQKTSGEIQFTMRRVEGKTLRRILSELKAGKEVYDEYKLLSIFFKVCDAVAYAHSKQVIHRDLKPENIMVGEFGEVYVMDWGIAKNLKTKEPESSPEDFSTLGQSLQSYHTKGGIGTPGYMAPEQMADASKVTAQADIYALGKMLKELFTCLSPLEEMKIEFRQRNFFRPGSQTKQSKTAEFEINKKIPVDIQNIVKKAVSEDLLERYQKVNQLKIDLEQYQKKELDLTSELTFQEVIYFIRFFTIIGLAFSLIFFFDIKIQEPEPFGLRKQIWVMVLVLISVMVVFKRVRLIKKRRRKIETLKQLAKENP